MYICFRSHLWLIKWIIYDFLWIIYLIITLFLLLQKHSFLLFFLNYSLVEKELVISSTSTEVEIALIENAHLVEIHSQKVNNNFSVGDIFLGSVKKLMPGLNAAFIEIRYLPIP